MDPSLQHHGLVAAQLALVALWLWKVGRRFPVEAVAAVLVGAAVWWGVPPSALPVGWLNGLQEGSSDVLLRVARGEGGHGGPLWTKVWRSIALRQETRLDAVVVLNLGFAAAAAVATWAWARQRLDAARATAVTLAFAGSAPALWAATSEGPAPLVWVVAALTPGLGWASALPVVLLMAVRVELVWLGLGLAAPEWRPPTPRPAWLVGWLAVGVAGQLVLERWRGALDQAAWVFQALLPQDTAPLLAVLFLLATFGPGLTAAVLVGGWRRPALGLLTLFAWKVYVAAGHGMLPGQKGFVADLELVRYLGLMLPALVVLAVEGLASMTSRRWLWVGLVLVPGAPGVLAAWPWTSTAVEGRPLWAWGAPLDRDAQREVRVLVELLRARPACALVTVGDDGGLWVSRGREGRTFPRMERVGSLDAVSGCAWFVRGLSCADHACPAAPPDALRVVVPEAPYGHPDHKWWRGGYVLEAWPLAR
jgi:hypothetical protein